MRTLSIFIFFFLSLSTISFSQTKISGKVLDEKKKGLPGVNVLIKGSYDGSTSKDDGSFEFETDEEGPQVLVFQLMGFKSIEIAIHCEGNAIQIPDQILVEAITEMNAVTISAGAMEASDEKKSVILQAFKVL